MLKTLTIMLLTVLWVVPLVYALANILNYENFGITMRCLYFSFGCLGYLITNKLVKL